MKQQQQNLQDDGTNVTSNRDDGLSLRSRLLSRAAPFITAKACRPNGTVYRHLLNLVDICTPPSITPIDGVKSSDHTIDASRKLWFRMFVPVNANSSQLPVIIYFHGGGFVLYSASTVPFDFLCRQIARSSPAIVISVNYRLAPEHKCPAQYIDGFDLVNFIDSEIRDKVSDFPANADVRRCFLAGDSSGGNLAHHVAVRCGGFEFKEVRIRGLVMIQPFFGGERRTASEIRLGVGPRLQKTDFFWKAFLPNGADRDHPASNVFGPGSSEEDIISFSGIEYPATLVVIGGLDLLQDRQRSYVNGLKRSGKQVELVEYPDADHGFCCAAQCPEYDMLIGKVSEFVQNH
ncbi:putative carboxylesterase 18 [Silene latifolia]|uniref:putative carboxylesterase 18 n=1 Tax=Silene latifolia TaxID=37657 RepID=UPI003D781A2A